MTSSRSLLTLVGFGLLLLMLVGCSSPSDEPVAPTATTPANSPAESPMAATDQPSTPEATATPTARVPEGELRVGMGLPGFPAGFDPLTFGSYAAVRFGVGETLTRLTPEITIEPWLAESVEPVTPTTWQVNLRDGVTFQDGSPLTAQDVAACFREVIDGRPSAAAFIPQETEIVAVDARTVTFTTPSPIGAFPNNLANSNFPVFKRDGEAVYYTGPYKVAEFETDTSATLEAYTGHWDGPPPLATIRLRVVSDTQAQLLGVQAGDLDMATSLVPEEATGLPDEVEAHVVPGLRLNMVIFNFDRPIFADKAVREAFALGIDRDAINTAVFDGQGEAATALFPTNVAGFDVIHTQSTDVERAAQLLDEAGWVMGSDGVRVKDGERLSFELPCTGATAALIGVVIQAQLSPLGFDIQPLNRAGYDWLFASDFEATVSSTNTLPTGDPGYFFNVQLAEGANFNFGKYANSEFDALIDQLRVEPDPAERNRLSREVQEILGEDFAFATVAISPRVEAIRADKVTNYTLHPSDLYVIDNKIGVE